MARNLDARNSFGKAIETNPHHAESYYRRALALVKLESVEAAGEDFFKSRLLGLEKKLIRRIEEIIASYYNKGLDDYNSEKYVDAVYGHDTVGP